MTDSAVFQDYLPGKVCFGCGADNPQGLQIKSRWEGDLSVCDWSPRAQHEGWAGLTCGGVIATIVDCHCIATAMATAYRNENRALDSEPRYLFATGTLNVKYLKPTDNRAPLRLQAQVSQIKMEKKYTVHCDVYSQGEKTAEAEVICLLVYRSDRPEEAPAKASGIGAMAKQTSTGLSQGLSNSPSSFLQWQTFTMKDWHDSSSLEIFW